MRHSHIHEYLSVASISCRVVINMFNCLLYAHVIIVAKV